LVHFQTKGEKSPIFPNKFMCQIKNSYVRCFFLWSSANGLQTQKISIISSKADVDIVRGPGPSPAFRSRGGQKPQGGHIF